MIRGVLKCTGVLIEDFARMEAILRPDQKEESSVDFRASSDLSQPFSRDDDKPSTASFLAIEPAGR